MNSDLIFADGDDRYAPSVAKRRRVVHRSPSHTVRLVHVPFLQAEPIEADSSLERDFIHVAALCPQCANIDHQPFRMDLEVGSYTPDFLIQFKDGSRAVVEVKPQALLAGHEQKLAQATEKLTSHGLTFVLALDTHIRTEGRSGNAKRVRRYGKSHHSSTEAELALQLLQGRSHMLIAEMVTAGVSRPTLAHLVCLHRLELNPHFGLDDLDTVRLVDYSNSKKGESDAVRFASWLTA